LLLLLTWLVLDSDCSGVSQKQARIKVLYEAAAFVRLQSAGLYCQVLKSSKAAMA